MNQEIKNKWIAALKSGEYQQGTGFLKQDGKFCCLGVLCDIHAKETGNLFNTLGKYLGENRILPKEVVNWSGISSASGRREYSNSLWELNDIDGFSFSQIADIIEKHF